jgi:hypothetical protein
MPMSNPSLEIDNNLSSSIGFTVGAILASAFWWLFDGFIEPGLTPEDLLFRLVMGLVACWLGGGIVGAEFCRLTNYRPRIRSTRCDRRSPITRAAPAESGRSAVGLRGTGQETGPQQGMAASVLNAKVHVFRQVNQVFELAHSGMTARFVAPARLTLFRARHHGPSGFSR